MACAIGLLAVSCAAAPAEEVRRAPVAPLPAGALFDYQLGGAYPPPAGTELVVRDSTAEAAPGLYNVCYVNGFQTQPDERAQWLEHRRDLVLSDADGRPLVDPNWPDELILDTSTAANRERLAEIVGQTVRGCARKGFDAVEIDNLDTFTRSAGALRAEDNLAFAAELARIAHSEGLAIGQKNTAEYAVEGKRAGFDFAVAEECVQFAECAAYTEVYGERVIDIEYTDAFDGDFGERCGRPGVPEATILRDRQLVPPGDPDYVYRRC